VTTCTLEVGERVVLHSKGGPPEAEYALFDPGEIELFASEPGTVREVGYRTVAEAASQRLEAAGVTPSLALEAASAIGPSLATAYARGSAVRRVASLLGPVELFDGAVYEHELRRYEGRWLDLPALGLDVELSRATTLMQALYLSALLHELGPETPVVMRTHEHSRERRPGERSFRRVSLEHAANLPEALRALAGRDRRTPHRERETGPTRDDLLEALHERAGVCCDDRARDRISAIAGAMSQRQRPARGPLADAELWSIEEQLSAGNAFGVVERLDSIDKRVGRHPATAYLRARASLLTGREPARVIAERATTLAMSMTTFGECELLAAEAWCAAGDVRRAIPFARDLVSNPNAHEELRARALRIVESAERRAPVEAPPTARESETFTTKPSTLPPPGSSPPRSDLEESFHSVAVSHPPARSVGSVTSRTPGAPWKPSPLPAVLSIPTPLQGPLPGFAERIASSPALGERHLSSARQSTVDPTRLEASSGSSQRKVAIAAPVRMPSARYASTPRTARLTPRAMPAQALDPGVRQTHWTLDALMQGASLPPYRSDSPGAHGHIPKAPRLPAPASGREAERAATLALPPGLTGTPAPVETLPSSVIEARVQFTFLAREIAREYRAELGVELRMDVSCVEAIQARMLERYPERKIATVEQAHDMLKHGALLSELLARTLDAFWVDIAPSDLGYWAMVVPPATRVWPFGRILRLIQMQHDERDLVAYYLELQSRAV
jgi:hypothetical protein